MATIFDAIAQSIGVALGADQTVGGWVAGITFSVVLIFIFIWTFGDDERSGNVFFGAILIGFTISGMVGWFPIWVPFVMAVFIIFLIIDPLNIRGGG